MLNTKDLGILGELVLVDIREQEESLNEYRNNRILAAILRSDIDYLNGIYARLRIMHDHLKIANEEGAANAAVKKMADYYKQSTGQGLDT